MIKVAVVTPTIGSDTLKKCIESVQIQTYENLTHYIFIDGEEHLLKVTRQENTDISPKHPIKFIGLQENVGKGWYGHRVYAACSFLVNADVICYLDEDNWYDEDHVESLVKTLQDNDCDWVYSLRKIYNKEGKYLFDDNCESLGKWPVYFDESVHHIDTSSFAVRTEIATKIGHSWYGQWGADRQFFYNLKKFFSNYSCSGKHSLCYRLDGNPNSVSDEFFLKGNEINSKKYNNNFPWVNREETLQVAPNIKIIF